MRKTYFILFAAIAWFIISVVLLTLPGTAFPTEDWLDKIWFDKWVHIGMFSILTSLWCLSFRSMKVDATTEKLKQMFIIIGILCLGYGIGMEFIQKYFIPYRSFDVGDMVVDAIGSTIGVVFSTRRYIKK